MANPQLENGHTQIANEILDAFCRCFPGGANARVLLAVIRATYGWHKREDNLSISHLEQMTGLSRRAVIYALQNLEAQKFITIKRLRGRNNVNQPNLIAFQKNYDLWVVQRNSAQYEKQLQNQREKYHTGVVQRNRGSAKNGQKVVQRNEKKCQFFAPTKEIKIITKDNDIIPPKRKYGEFQNVLLSEEELQKLKDKLGGQAEAFIEKLSAYMESRGKRYKSHYATILNWWRRDKEAYAKNRNPREIPKPEEYTPTPDYPELRGIE